MRPTRHWGNGHGWLPGSKVHRTWSWSLPCQSTYHEKRKKRLMNIISTIVSFIMTLQYNGLLSYHRLLYHPTWNSDLLCSGFNQNVYGWFNPLFFFGWLVGWFCCSFLKLELNDMLWLAEAFPVLDASTSRCVWFKKLTSISIDHVQARTSSISFHGKSSFYCADCIWLRESRDVPVEWTFSEIKFTVMRTSFDHDKLRNFMQRCLCAK